MSEKIICTVTNDLVFDQRMHRICTTLQKNGYSVELVGRVLKDSIQLSEYSFKQTRIQCFFNKGFLFYAEYNIRLLIFLLINSFDIVCSCDLDTLVPGVLASKWKGKKVVYDAHEYFTESPELIGKPIKQSVWLTVEKLFVPKADAMYTVTKSLADLFNKKYNIDCKLIQNLPFKNNRTIHPSGNTTTLLYQGAVNIGRGLNEMLLVMLNLDNAEFHIAGDGDEMHYINNGVSELGLKNRVKLLGKLSPEKLKSITEKAYIGINLLENRGLSYYYSMGNKTFDYIQAAVPQIMIGFPEYIELNKKYNIGLVVDELNVEKITAAIQCLLNDASLYQHLRQNCILAQNDLCWEKEETKLLNIYEQL